jgi:hypothetical protein
MKRFRHLFCRTFLWEAIDPTVSFWVIKCTKCGYVKDIT